MARLFKNVQPTRLKRNPFNMSHDVKLTTEFGRLTPILCKEVVPGDSFRLRSEMLIRTAPLYAPLMHRVNAYVHYFYVPARLLMDDWETFITGGKQGDSTKVNRQGQTIPVNKPVLTYQDLVRWFNNKVAIRNVVGECSLFDYLGFPAANETQINNFINHFDQVSDQPIDLLPFKAYQLIYNEYYRDETLEDEVDIMSDQNGNLMTWFDTELPDPQKQAKIMNHLFTLKQRNWEKDYFTSALTSPQRGSETTLGDDDWNVQISGDGIIPLHKAGTEYSLMGEEVANHLQADLQGGSLVSINELRRALAVQKFKERSARYGYRLTEFLRGFFGVQADDARLQRPEFLGGFKQQLQFGEVLQTSETTDTSPQGGYAGTGYSLAGGKYIKRYFKEHGYLFGILSVMPKPAYMQGWPKEFDRWERYDYYVPDFAHLGEQEILKKELNFVPMQVESNNMVFGYTPRYADYKFALSRVCGNMRSTLDFWHMARRIPSGQNLNKTFLELNSTEMDRVFNVVTHEVAGEKFDHLWLQIYHDIRALRPMPKYGTPLI